MGELAEFKGDTTIYILKEMFKCVGQEFDPELVKTEDWYLKYSWTTVEQEYFKRWLAAFLKRCHKGVGKKKSEREAEWFVMHCGWKVDDLKLGVTFSDGKES